MDIQDLMQKAMDVQRQMASLQDEIGKLMFEGSAGGGMVTVTVTGKHRVTRVHIDPELLKNPDAEMLQDLVAAAVNQAAKRAEDGIAEMMRKRLGPLAAMPGIGGLMGGGG